MYCGLTYSIPTMTLNVKYEKNYFWDLFQLHRLVKPE